MSSVVVVLVDGLCVVVLFREEADGPNDGVLLGMDNFFLDLRLNFLGQSIVVMKDLSSISIIIRIKSIIDDQENMAMF